LVGILDCKLEQSTLGLSGAAKVAGQGNGLAGAGVSFGQKLCAHPAVLCKPASVQLLRLDRALVVAELADQIIVPCDGAPAQQQAREHLHGSLPLDYPLPLIAWRAAILVIGSIGARRLFLDLQEQRIVPVASEEQDHVIPRSDAARAYHFEAYVH